MNTKLFAGVLCAAAVSLWAAEKLPISGGKAWRVTKKTELKTFKPVILDNEIKFGPRSLKLSADSSMLCVSSEAGELFTFSNYFWVTDNKKHQWNYQRENFDKEKSTFTRNGNRFEWETWYKNGDKGVFRFIKQTLEVLPDGRLRLSVLNNVPATENGRKFNIASPAFGLKYPYWAGKVFRFNGKNSKLLPENKAFRSKWKKDCTWEFADPANPFSLSILGKETGHLRFESRKTQNRFVIPFDGGKKDASGRLNIVYIDLRKSTSSSGNAANIRGGINFTAQENLLLPDISHKNLFNNSSFERGFEDWSQRIFHSNGNTDYKWIPWELESKEVYHGKYALKFNAKQFTYWGFSPTAGPLPLVLAPGKYTISFHAKTEPGKRAGMQVVIPNFHSGSQFNALNRSHWKFTVTPKWKRYTASFTVPEGKPLIHILFYGYTAKGRAAVYLDAVQLEKGTKATAFAPAPAEGRLITSAEDNFLSSKDKINGKFQIITAKPDAKGKARITVKNFFGEILLDKTVNFKTGKDKTQTIALPLDKLPGLGIFVVKAEYTLANGTKSYDLHRYTRINYQDMPRPNKRMFCIDYGSPFSRFLALKVLDRWQKIGIGALHRHSHRSKELWDLEKQYGLTDQSAGMFNYVRTPQMIAAGKKPHFYISSAVQPRNNIKLDDPQILIRDFYLDGNGTITPEYLEKFRNAVKTVAKKYPHVKLWSMAGELSNKLDNDWWKKGGTDEDRLAMHAMLLKAFVQGVKDAGTGAKTYQGAPMNMHERGGIAETDGLLAACNKIGAKFDIIGIHPYRFAPENPDTDADTLKLFSVMKKHGYGDDVKVYMPEGMHWGPYNFPQWRTTSSSWGGPPITWIGAPLSLDMGWTEKKSAAWYTRSWLVGLKYADRIMGMTAGSMITNNYMDLMLTPYSALIVPNTLCNILGDAKFKKDVRFAPYIRTYIFEDAAKRPVAAVWCHKENVDDGSADAPVAAADFGKNLESVLDLMNSPRAFKPGKMQFAISGFPLFFRGKPGTLKQMIKAFESAEIISGDDMSPLHIQVNPADRKNMSVTMTNFMSAPFSGKLRNKTVKLPGAGKTEIILPMAKQLRYDKITKIPAQLDIVSDKGTKFSCAQNFHAFAVKRVPESAKLETVNWKQLPQIKLQPRKNCKASGAFRLGWNRFGLFMEVEVKDKKFVHIEYADPSDRWNNDCVQFYIDTMANARSNTVAVYDADDYDYAIFPNRKGTSAQLFRMRTVDSQLGLATVAPKDKTFAPDVPCTFSNKNGVLTYRIFMPGKYLMPIVLKKGWAFGLSIFVPDSNSPRKTSGSLTIATDGQHSYNRPAFWPVAILD